MSLMVYDLQNISGKDVQQLYTNNNCEVDEDSLLNSLKLTIKKWSNNDKVYKIIRYNKTYLSTDLIRSSGLFRSVILNDKGKIISFSPPKSLRPDDFIKSHKDEEISCIAEEYVEGTMINLFYDNGEWEIATRSSVGAKISFFRINGASTTFRNMFLEVCNYINLDFDMLDKNYSYSFVMQHPDNRIVSPIFEKSLYLVRLYRIDGFTVHEVNYREHVTELIKKNDKLVLRVPERYKFTSFDELKEKYASMNTMYDQVGVMLYSPSGDRTKFRNPTYEDVRMLRGNQPKLQYHYLSLRRTGKMAQFLKYFPEYKQYFTEFREQLHRFTNAIHKNYIECYINKKRPLKEFPQQYRSLMFNLHQYYLNELREKGEHVSRAVVIEHINTLPAAHQMFLLNYNMRKHVIDEVKHDINENNDEVTNESDKSGTNNNTDTNEN
jgi:hypothetical protein